MDHVRFRLRFVDPGILTASQETEGLNRSWLLLKPHLQTVAQLSFYLTRLFQLHHSCPDGILLSIDGFVLPHFESTSIIKGEDLIWKRGVVGDVAELCDGGVVLELEGMVQKPDVNKLLLANEEFEKEIGGYQSEEEEEGIDELSDEDEALKGEIQKPESRKRKTNRKVKSSKRKSKKRKMEEPEEVDSDTQLEKNKDGRQLSSKTLKAHSKKNKPPSLARDNTLPTKSDGSSESMLKEDRNSKPKENGRCSPDSSQLPDGTKKGPSRSARRKKAKRRWLREKSKLENELKQKASVVEKDHQESSEESSDKSVMKDEGPTVTKDQHLDDDDVDEEVVPIEIRPGHIRFEPRSKDRDVLQTQLPVERFQWNGITSKKKGQKWGMDKGTNRSWKDDYQHSQETCITMTSKDEIPKRCNLVFETLEPYAGLPKKGDLMAYRLMELSSSWCPEVSSFRVGKISSYDPESNVIRLESVPEYPFTIESNQDEEEDCALESDNSPYNEDGSLEVEFSSIVDPRIVKRTATEAPEEAAPKTTPAAENKVSQLNNGLPNMQEKISAPTPGNGAVANTWDEVIQVLSAKKQELSAKENRQEKNQNSGKSAWSYRAMRGSALGPIMARLREQNELEGK
uniref:Coilin n=1 Tax=Kalanchoe fedtschenkoi TaxID=63787 RepID=A0A7N0TEL9_KALFE